MLVEIGRLEPLTLLRRIDGRQVVLAWGQAADPVLAGLIGPRRHDVARLRPPERRVGGKGEHRELRHRRAVVGGQLAADLALLVGEDQGRVGDVLAAAHLKRRVGHVAAADRDRLQEPGPRAVARPDQVRAGRDAADREVSVLVDARVRLRAEVRLVGRGRRDPELRVVGRRRAARQKRHRAADRRAWGEDDGDARQVGAVDADRLRRELGRFRIVAAGPQDVAPRRHVVDREGAVPLDAAAEVHAHGVGARAARVGHQVDVAARDRRAVRVRDDAADPRHAHELHAEADVEHFLAQADRNRLGFVH